MYSPKSSSVAGLLGIFLGAFGAHDWYLGNRQKSAKTHVVLAVASILCFTAVTIIRAVASSGQTPTTLTLMNNIATILDTIAWLVMLGDVIWGAIEGIILLAQGDAGLTARGYFVKGDPNNPLAKSLSTSTVRQLDGTATVEPHPTATPHVPVVLPTAPTLEQQGSNVKITETPLVFRSSDIHSTSTFDRTNQPITTPTTLTSPQSNANVSQAAAVVNNNPSVVGTAPNSYAALQPAGNLTPTNIATPPNSLPTNNALGTAPAGNYASANASPAYAMSTQSTSTTPASGYNPPTSITSAQPTNAAFAQPANPNSPQPINNAPAQPAPYRRLPKPTTAIGTKTIDKTKTPRPKFKFDFRSPVFIKIAISIAIAAVVVIAGFIVKWVIESTANSGYGETYLAAKELSAKLDSLSRSEGCDYVVSRVNVASVDNATYENYITNCQDLLGLSPLIDKLGQTPAIGWNEAIAADFNDFKALYDESFPNPEQAATTTSDLELYRIWHAYLVAADLLTVDSSDEEFQRAAAILTSSENETLSNYGQEWLTRELEYINAYRTYSQASFDDPAKGALRQDMELKRNNLENWVADHRPDLKVIAPIATPDLTRLSASYARLYERIKRGYAQHYDPKIGGCDNSTSTVICQ